MRVVPVRVRERVGVRMVIGECGGKQQEGARKQGKRQEVMKCFPSDVSFPLFPLNNSPTTKTRRAGLLLLLQCPGQLHTSMASTNSPPKTKGQPPLSSGPPTHDKDKTKTHNQHIDQDQEDDGDYFGDHAEDLAEQYDDGEGGGGGGGGGGHQKAKQEKRTLHTGKGTRHKLELLEKAKHSISPPSGRTSPPPKG